MMIVGAMTMVTITMTIADNQIPRKYQHYA